MAATPLTRKLTTRNYDFLELDRIATSRRGVCVTDARPPPALTRVASSSSSYGIGGVYGGSSPDSVISYTRADAMCAGPPPL